MMIMKTLKKVEPRPEFQSLTLDDVRLALQHPDPENPIAREISRLVAGYTDNFQRHVDELGYVPVNVLRMTPRWPIEAEAMRLATETIRKAVNKIKKT
jgi:hypothetical protein